jgi:hypothetical protein
MAQPEADVGRSPFSAVCALVAGGPGHFTADVNPEWTIVGKPNGGYLLAMLGGAAAAVTTHHPHVIAASAHYLHSPDPGPLRFETEVLRTGRSASQVRARMRQDGQPCVEAILTTSRLGTTAAPYWDRGVPDMGHRGFEDCPRLIAAHPRREAAWRSWSRSTCDWSRAADGFTEGHPSGRGELRGWLSLPDGESFDTTSLLFAVDAFPPATFEIEFSGWVPTLELTAYIRALPAPGPVRVLQRAHLIDDQRVDEVMLRLGWSAGRLVAQGTQLAGIRLG